MKKWMHFGILTGALLVGNTLPLGAQPAQPPYNSGETNNWGGTNQSPREQWKAMREQLAAEIKAQDAELEQLVTQMNNAPADQKTDAIAAVVNKMVEDRLAIHNQLEAMHRQMSGTNAPPEQGTNALPPTP